MAKEKKLEARAEAKAVGRLLKTAKFAGTPQMDYYEIPEVKKLDINLPKRLRVFREGESIDERFKKFPPIKRDLYRIKGAIESAKKHEIAGAERDIDEVFEDMRELDYGEFRGKYGETKERVMAAVDSKLEKSGKGKVDWEEGTIELAGIDKLVPDPMATYGAFVFTAFLEHYVDKVAENIGRAIDKAEALRDIERLKERAGPKYGVWERTFAVPSSVLEEEFRKNRGVSKRELLEEARLRRLKHGRERFASDIGAMMFGHDSLETYRESDTGLLALGRSYAYKLIMRSKGKREIAGVERPLSEIFKGLHGLDEAEFRGKFGESKKRVVESISKRFYSEDVPEMYEEYLGDLRKFIGKTPTKDLEESFSGGETYKELLGGKTPEELRRELAEGVADYKKAIAEVSSLFVPEQYEEARRIIRERDLRFSPRTKYQKDMAAKEKTIGALKSLKKGKELKDKNRGELMGAYIKSLEKYCK